MAVHMGAGMRTSAAMRARRFGCVASENLYLASRNLGNVWPVAVFECLSAMPCTAKSGR